MQRDSWYIRAVASLLVAYFIFGPIVWAGVLVLSWFARTRMNRLSDDAGELPAPAPSLNIVVPARNESAGIADCVHRIRQQDYPDAQVVVINDRSTDDTGRILDSIARDDSRVRPIHVTDLPPGWLGKCHALAVGTRGLTSDWLLFVDSDVLLSSDAARRAVALCERRKYDALSLMTRLVAPTLLEKTLLPMLATAWAGAFQISLTNDDSKPGHAFANGQFFLIRRTVYEEVRGHEAVRDRIVEDVELMRVLKRSGARVRLMFAQHLAQTRMHTNLKQMFHGWARIFAGTSGRALSPILGTIAFLLVTLLLLVAGIVAATTLGGPWIIAAGLHVAFVLGFVAWAYRMAGQSPLLALLLPASWPMVIVILSYAAKVCFTGRVDWRGNAVTVNRN